MIINGNQIISLNGSILLKHKNIKESFKITEPKQKFELHGFDHPFSNISVFINLQHQQKTLLYFGKSFQYRLNPQVSNIYDQVYDERNTKTNDNFSTISSGQTVLIFEGKHFNSVLYPMLSLYFERDNKYESAASVFCTVVSATIVTCLLPAVPKEMQKIEIERPVKARYVLHLDGYQIDSDKLPVSSGAIKTLLKGTRILYYPQPEFTVVDKPIFVSSSSMQVELHGRNLVHDFPYKIVLNNSIMCIVTHDTNSLNILRCKLIAEQKIIDNIYGKELELNVTIGSYVKRLVFKFAL